MLKSLHSILRKSLSKGGPGSGRHKEGGSREDNDAKDRAEGLSAGNGPTAGLPISEEEKYSSNITSSGDNNAPLPKEVSENLKEREDAGGKPDPTSNVSMKSPNQQVEYRIKELETEIANEKEKIANEKEKMDSYSNFMTTKSGQLKESLPKMESALKDSGFKLDEITSVNKTGSYGNWKDFDASSDKLRVDMRLSMTGRVPSSKSGREVLGEKVESAFKERTGQGIHINQYSLDRKDNIIATMWL